MDAPAGLFLLSESSDHLFFIYDRNINGFTYLNPAFRTFFGFEKIDPEAGALLGMVHGEDKSYVLEKLVDLNISRQEGIECRFIKGQNERSLRISAYVNRCEGKGLIMGVAEDISLYKANTEVLHEHGNKKNAILNILTHDLAGPIGAIGNFCDLINREHSGQQYADLHNYISRVKEISNGCIRMIRDFLNQEFLESAGVRLLKKRVDLAEKINSLVEQYKIMHNELGINFVINVADGNVFVDIDEDKFLQVINNLISNSLKYQLKERLRSN